MNLESITKTVEEDIHNGNILVPCSEKLIYFGEGTCLIPRTPDSVSVELKHLGRVYRSVDPKDYDEVGVGKRLDDFLEYIGDPAVRDEQVFRGSVINFSYENGIFGKLPQKPNLDSLEFDNRIILRPAYISDIFHLQARLGYNMLEIDHGGGVISTEFNRKIDFSNKRFIVDLGDSITTNNRIYTLSKGKLHISRGNTWFNPNSKGVEGQIRLPFEIITQLLEPFTSTRIIVRNLKLNKKIHDYIVEWKKIGKEDEISKVRKDIKGYYIDIVKRGITEERIVGEILAKSWMIDRNISGFSREEVMSWNSGRDREDDSFMNDLFSDIKNLGPERFVKFYASRAWRDTFDFEEEDEEHEAEECWENGDNNEIYNDYEYGIEKSWNDENNDGEYDDGEYGEERYDNDDNNPS